MNKEKWKDCCSEAISVFREAGIATVTTAGTVMKWHRFFRVHLSLKEDARKNTKEYVPKLFVVYPEARALINKYFIHNLESVNVDEFRNHVLEKVFPQLLNEMPVVVDGVEPLSFQDLLSSINLKTLGLATAYKYLRFLGYKFDLTRKSYYNDGHEKPEQVEYRKRFISDYFKKELSCYLWIQITEETAIQLENSNREPLQKHISFDYIHNGINMREYHVDAHDQLLQYIAPENLHYGGNLSVRISANTRPIICIGEDESAYSQYSFSSKNWKGPNGEEKMKPKGEGETLMVAGFASRSFGLGRTLTEGEKIRINLFRKEKRSDYLSNVEALAVNGSKEKKEIIDNSPFIRFFEVGAEKEGFWNYNRMALMTEDLVDCCQVIYPSHDILLYFDQSSGHCRKRHDGLNVVGMNGDWGGVQQTMRNTTIAEGCIGPYNNRTLTIGDVQSLVFTEQDFGPIHMKKNQNRTDRKYDRVIGRKIKRKTKVELMKELIEKKQFNPTRQYTRKQIEAIATELGLLLDHEVGEVSEGWLGKPKGMYQILWERGWIDETKKFSDY
jgi:hypothetical protein